MEAGPSNTTTTSNKTAAPVQSAATLAAFTNAAFTTSGALVDLVDRKVLLVLRDHRTLIGILRSYDQFANLVLQNTVERFYCDQYWAEAPRGIYVIRGENVLMMGEVDLGKEDDMPSHMQQASVEDVAQLKKEAEDRQKSSALRKADVLKEQKGFALDHAEGDTFFMS